MKISSPAMVFDLNESDSSPDFLIQYLGCEISTQGEGFIALGHKDHDMHIIFRTLISDQEIIPTSNLQIGFIVKAIDSLWNELKDFVTISDKICTTHITHERSFQIVDPNGIAYRPIEFI